MREWRSVAFEDHRQGRKLREQPDLDRGQAWLEVRLVGMAGADEGFGEVALIRDVSGERRVGNLRQVLYEMTLEAQRVQEPEELFSALQRVLNKVMEARNLFVALYDRERGLLTFPFYRDEAEPRAPEPMSPGRTLTAQVLRTGRPLFLHSPAYCELEERGEVEVVGPDSTARWASRLRQGQAVTGPLGEFPDDEREFLARHGLQSLALIPVPVADRWWGFMAFEDHRRVRYWSETEIEALRLAAATLGAAIHHRETEQRLRTVEKMEAIDQLTSGIAHDFNNLLMAIRGAVEQLQGHTGPTGEACRENVGIIETASRGAADLTRRLLAFSRRQVMEPRPLDLNELLRRFLPTARRVLPENIQICLALAESLDSIHADPVQIEQILMNLLVNARDAMPEGGTVTIRTGNAVVDGELMTDYPWARPGPHVLLTISDTGKGMDPETLAHIFEPFFTTKGPGEGTGLGLSTVYGIVKQHGGMIHLSSEPGRGTTAEIYFPGVTASPMPIAAPTEVPVEGGEETLLLVEDDPGVRRVVRGLLAGLGYLVLTAEDGRRAMEVLEERDGAVDLGISDVVMPRMGGAELAEAAGGRWPELRFLFMTGYSANAVHEGFVKKEGVSFLTKPFSRDDLARAVRSELRR